MCDQPIQIAVIGDKAVGKTSIIRQWLSNDYSSIYHSTRMATYHFSSLFNGQRLFHIRIIDTPKFDTNHPRDPQQEWVRMYCYRCAHVFLLIFDLNRDETFQYIKQIYRDIIRVRFNLDNSSTDLNRDDPSLEINQYSIPVIVVANKIDLISTDLRLTNTREIQQYVKKTWQSTMILCSAKFHWHLVFLFKEVCHMLETVEDTVAQQARRRLQQQQQSGKHCQIM